MATFDIDELRTLWAEQDARMNLSDSDVDMEAFLQRKLLKRKRGVAITNDDEPNKKHMKAPPPNHSGRSSTNERPSVGKSNRADKGVLRPASSDPLQVATSSKRPVERNETAPPAPKSIAVTGTLSASPATGSRPKRRTDVPPHKPMYLPMGYSREPSGNLDVDQLSKPKTESDPALPTQTKNASGSKVTSSDPIEESTPGPTRMAGRAKKQPSAAKLQEQREKEERKRIRAETAQKKKDKIRMDKLEKKMTPKEYAVHTREKSKKFAERLALKDPGRLCFKGMNILYVDRDYKIALEGTRNKLDRVSNTGFFARPPSETLFDQIVQRGGNLMTEYDPNVTTHIIAEPEARNHILRATGVKKSIREVPIHIHVLAWKWASLKLGGITEMPVFHELFAERLDMQSEAEREKLDASSRAKSRRASSSHSDTNKESIIEDFTASVVDPFDPEATPEKRRPPDRYLVEDSQQDLESKGDPLEEFYEQAKAMKDDDVTMSDEEDAGQKRKPIFQCDKTSGQPHKPGDCPNQDVIDKLTELQALHKAKPSKDDFWRNYSYNKSIRNLKAYPKRITSVAEAMSIKDVGRRTAEKIMEIISSGSLVRIRTESTEDVRVTQIFTKIYGVGAQTAYSWFSLGLRTLEDVQAQKGGIKLSSVQKIGLKYFDDINTRIPREEVSLIFEQFKEIALEIDPKLYVEVMGSYRRGAKSCGDIDVLITRPTTDGRTHRGVMRRLLKRLHDEKLLTHDLSIPDDLDDLEASYRGLCKKDEKSTSLQRRIDILSVPYESLGGALIYYTGDDIFNRSIRLKANKMGFGLNQRGLYVGVVRDPLDRHKKLSPGNLLKGKTERQIFKMLEVPWQEPHERIRDYAASRLRRNIHESSNLQ